jgi:drug/metabolite transporter (DMT)-like permease
VYQPPGYRTVPSAQVLHVPVRQLVVVLSLPDSPNIGGVVSGIDLKQRADRFLGIYVNATWLLLFATVCLTSAGQLLLKLGTIRPAFQGAIHQGQVSILRAALTEPLLLTGITFYGLSTVCWVLVLARLELSVAYPLAMTSVIAVLLLSWATLGETFGPLRILGALFIIVGAICVIQSQAA